jgi:hypothetical protein
MFASCRDCLDHLAGLQAEPFFGLFHHCLPVTAVVKSTDLQSDLRLPTRRRRLTCSDRLALGEGGRIVSLPVQALPYSWRKQSFRVQRQADRSALKRAR